MGKPGNSGGSGGGSIPNAPDLSGNVKSANEITGTATSDAAQTMNTAKAYNENAQKTLGTVVGATTPTMANLNNTANTNLSTYGNSFVPLQAKQAEDAANYTANNAERNRSMAMGDQAAAAEAARKNSAQALASEGVDPASIHGGALDRQAAITSAANIAGAGTQSQLNTEQTGRALTSQANQLGLQIGNAGNSAAEAASGVGSGIVNNTNSTNATGINNMTASNAYLGTGINANSSASNIANTQFQDQMTQYQAQQAAASSSAGALGGLASGALSFVASNPEVLAAMDRGGPVSHAGALPFSPIPGSTDTKPALLTPGEFVIPKPIVDFKGHEFFHKLVDKVHGEIAQRQGIPHPGLAGATYGH